MAVTEKTRNGKIVVVGDGACGKTCLLEVFKSGKFPQEYVPTVVDNFVKKVKLDDSRDITLAIWDTAGQEDYDTIRPLSYRETDLVLLCYTIESKKNLENIPTKWLMEIKNYCPSAGYYLIGLKSDLRNEKDSLVDKSELITKEDGKKMAEQIKALKFIECSALTRENVDELFSNAADEIYKMKESSAVDSGCMCFSCFCSK